jgi:hypothetical protein
VNDAYNDALSREEAQRIAYWECVEEDREDEDEDDDAPLTNNQRQWIYDNF